MGGHARAVCFDITGTLAHHEDPARPIPLMPDLVNRLAKAGAARIDRTLDMLARAYPRAPWLAALQSEWARLQTPR